MHIAYRFSSPFLVAILHSHCISRNCDRYFALLLHIAYRFSSSVPIPLPHFTLGCHTASLLHIASAFVFNHIVHFLFAILHSYRILHIYTTPYFSLSSFVFILFSHSPNLPWREERTAAKARALPSSHCGPTSGPFSVLRGRVIYPLSAPRPCLLYTSDAADDW